MAPAFADVHIGHLGSWHAKLRKTRIIQNGTVTLQPSTHRDVSPQLGIYSEGGEKNIESDTCAAVRAQQEREREREREAQEPGHGGGEAGGV